MKQFKIGYIDKSDLSIFGIAIGKTISNGFLLFENGELYFKSKFKDKEKASFSYVKNSLDTQEELENFCTKISDVIKSSHTYIQDIKDSEGNDGRNQDYALVNPSSINEHSIAHSLASYIMHNSSLNEPILFLSAKLLFNIATSHIYRNGNKRTAIFSMIFLLENFGLTVICKNENAINK
jgi:death-on-curing family protein